jgi:hypothetical protein
MPPGNVSDRYHDSGHRVRVCFMQLTESSKSLTMLCSVYMYNEGINFFIALSAIPIYQNFTYDTPPAHASSSTTHPHASPIPSTPP